MHLSRKKSLTLAESLLTDDEVVAAFALSGGQTSPAAAGCLAALPLGLFGGAIAATRSAPTMLVAFSSERVYIFRRYGRGFNRQWLPVSPDSTVSIGGITHSESDPRVDICGATYWIHMSYLDEFRRLAKPFQNPG